MCFDSRARSFHRFFNCFCSVAFLIHYAIFGCCCCCLQSISCIRFFFIFGFFLCVFLISVSHCFDKTYVLYPFHGGYALNWHRIALHASMRSRTLRCSICTYNIRGNAVFELFILGQSNRRPVKFQRMQMVNCFEFVSAVFYWWNEERNCSIGKKW